MDSASHQALCRKIALGAHSLLQYVSDSAPYVTGESAGVLKKVLALAQEERDAITRVVRWLQRNHLPAAKLGGFPSHFTTLNFVTLGYLLPKLVAENATLIAELELLLGQTNDEEARPFIESYLDMKRRHLATLTDLSPSTAPAAA